MESLFLNEMQIKNPGMAVTPPSPSARSFEPAENTLRGTRERERKKERERKGEL